MNNENVIKWLQISDVHIGHQDYVESVMREELPAYVKQLAAREKFDVIFITGDLRYYFYTEIYSKPSICQRSER